MSAVTTHVLDTARGRPAAGIPVILELIPVDDPARLLGQGITNGDGRLTTLLAPNERLERGIYRLTFDVGTYFRSWSAEAFFPSVVIMFEIREPAQHYHVPLLLSPHGYSTYRGS